MSSAEVRWPHARSSNVRGIDPIAVILGGDSLATKRSGIGRVTFEVAQELRRTDRVSALRLWVGEQFREPALLDHLLASEDAAELAEVKPRPLRMMIGRVPGIQALRSQKRRLTTFRDLSAMRRSTGDRLVYHEPNMITKELDVTTVAQVNDLSWLHHREMHPKERILWIDRHIDRTLRESARFVALSRFTADGLATEFGVARDRIDIVPCAASSIFHTRSADQARDTLARYGLDDGCYLLSVSTLEPRKNFDRLVEAHSRLPPALVRRFPLVIAGGSGWGTTLRNSVAEQARRDGTLRLLGHVPDTALVDITARAGVFVYVSLYEGFGLPVLEAMATGTPVIASSTTATCETAGDAGRLVDPLDPGMIAAAIREVLEDAALRSELSRKGLARSEAFTWSATVQGLLSSWERALA